MKTKFISTEGTYLAAIVEIEDISYCVMDEITLSADDMPKPGQYFDFQFSNLLDEDESWESIFTSNPQKKKCLVQLEGWKYKAYGEVISINPVVVDCGILQEEDVFHTNDPSVIGEFVAFTVSRLGGYAI